jgi:hypothetical protein
MGYFFPKGISGGLMKKTDRYNFVLLTLSEKVNLEKKRAGPHFGRFFGRFWAIFSQKHPVTLESGNSIFHQGNPTLV